MTQPYSLDDLSLLVETVELECKLAQGQDGKGEVPKDFWTTYSAFANTHGGVVLLGVREKDGQFSVAGLSNVEKVRTDLFNTLNNPAKVSINLLTDDDVVVRELEGKRILEVRVPAASRKQKPVFLNGQPLGNTYRRLHEGDRRCDEESVKRMFAEQVEDSRDERILPHYDLSDIDPDSLRIYRQMLSDRKANHPALEHQGVDFLRQIGGWRRDRATGQEGMLVSDGRSRGMMYHLPGEVMPTPEQVFEGPQPMPGYGSPAKLGPSSEHWNSSSEHFAVSSEHWNSGSEESDSNRDEVGRWISPHLPLPVVDSLDCLDENFRTRLETMAAEPRRKKKLARERMQQVLTALCQEQFMTLNVLARLVERNPDALRQQYLNEMVRHRQIQLAFPSRPTHERQAYRAASATDE
ncbi:AlbA family DNA-binding domain-containing protein [Pseudomonas indica]|uniref:AlbA family DNA-binding domain-containing protein n=1 Tax=Pseudomonas indica TaxID=137658 RepID=UPI0023F8A79A|nr:ATP-binding protein [Pseudomonas indica]MBU3058692.1 ATP-binding protein [Pseudomonas indica]